MTNVCSQLLFRRCISQRQTHCCIVHTVNYACSIAKASHPGGFPRNYTLSGESWGRPQRRRRRSSGWARCCARSARRRCNTSPDVAPSRKLDIIIMKTSGNMPAIQMKMKDASFSSDFYAQSTWKMSAKFRQIKLSKECICNITSLLSKSLKLKEAQKNLSNIWRNFANGCLLRWN